MEHIGIDLGSRNSHIVVMSACGTVQKRSKVQTAELGFWLEKRPPSRVVMESCTQSHLIAKVSRQAGHDVVVVPGQVVRALGVGARGIKTDDRDAEVMATASVRSDTLPSVHQRSESSRRLREVTAARATLMDARKSLALTIKSWLRGRLVTLRGRANSKHFTEAVRTVAREHPDGLPSAIEHLLSSYEQLCEHIEQLTEQCALLADADPVCQALMKVPGVGPMVSLEFKSQLDDPGRFGSADQLASYLALVPGENTTGGRIRRNGTIHAGPKMLKALLVQAAWSLWRCRPHEPIVVWARAIAERRNRRVAIIALARKLATVMWSMWSKNTAYDPARASSMRSATQACT